MIDGIDVPDAQRPDSVVYTWWTVDAKYVVKVEEFDHQPRPVSNLVLRSHGSKIVRVGSHGGEDQSLSHVQLGLIVS
jgi:hypothetical protein